MSDKKTMADSYCDWIVKEIIDDCMYTGLDLEDSDVRKAVIEGLRSAANYIEGLTNPHIKGA